MDGLAATAVGLGILVLVVGVLRAGVDGEDIARNCERSEGSPVMLLDMAVPAPDGQPRGTRSFAEYFQNAKREAAAGNHEQAIAWIEACQPSSIEAIRADRSGVIAYLDQ